MEPKSLRCLGHRTPAADRRHLSFVEVAEGLHELAARQGGDVARGMPAHLHGHRGHHGQRPLAIGHERRRVTDHPDIRDPGQPEELIDDEASRGTGLAKLTPSLGGGDTRGPDDRAGREDLAGLEVHVALIHPIDRRIELDDDTELFEFLLRVRTGVLREGRQQARTRLDERDGGLVGDLGVLPDEAGLQLGDGPAHLDTGRSPADDDHAQCLARQSALLHILVGVEQARLDVAGLGN